MQATRITTRAEHHYANARWLLKLRWVAVIGQLATIGGSIWLFQAQIPMDHFATPKTQGDFRLDSFI